MKFSIKINGKKIDKLSGIWYNLRVKDINPRLLDYELRSIFGKERLLKVIKNTDKSITVLIDR
jgi:hypothetical protein